MIPVNVITGFLGSGKTTLLSRLLPSPAFANCAVLINELGEVGLDHHLLEHIDQETILLQNGCICCSIRSDLRDALIQLHERRDARLLCFDRVIVETTGLADPAPALNTVVADPVLRHHYRLGNVVATVDAVNGPRHLRDNHEARRQIAIADRLVITKADLVEAGELMTLRGALAQLNASALVSVSHNDLQAPELLLDQDLAGSGREQEVRRCFYSEVEADDPPMYALTRKWVNAPHSSDISSISLTLDKPIDWVAFGVWLSMLLHSHGADILRVKGILNIAGSELPVVIHGVQHLIHTPSHLDAWPDDGRASKLVFIGRLPALDTIRASIESFACQLP
jgi:G3E family GTPase